MALGPYLLQVHVKSTSFHLGMTASLGMACLAIGVPFPKDMPVLVVQQGRKKGESESGGDGAVFQGEGCLARFVGFWFCTVFSFLTLFFTHYEGCR